MQLSYKNVIFGTLAAVAVLGIAYFARLDVQQSRRPHEIGTVEGVAAEVYKTVGKGNRFYTLRVQDPTTGRCPEFSVDGSGPGSSLHLEALVNRPPVEVRVTHVDLTHIRDTANGRYGCRPYTSPIHVAPHQVEVVK